MTRQDDFLLIGRIQAPHGLNGALRILPLTDDPDRFNDLKQCLLISPQKQRVRTLGVRFLRRQLPDKIWLSLAGVENRTQAQELRGFFLAVERDQAIALPPGRWFVVDLIGCTVTDRRHGHLGVLTDVLQGPAQDVYVVHLEGAQDLLIPALKTVLLEVDVASKRMQVALPDGLYDIYR